MSQCRLLLQRPVNSSEDQRILTREMMLGYLPHDLRQFAMVHDFNDAFSAYPSLNLTGDLVIVRPSYSTESCMVLLGHISA